MIKKLNNIKKLLKKWFESKEYDELANMVLEKNLSESIEIKKENRNIYTFYADVMGIIPKKEAFEIFLKNNFELNKNNNLIKWDYTPKDFKEIKGMYSVELLGEIMRLFKDYERCIIKVRDDSPLWIEVRDFIICLAPIESGQELI